MICENTYGNVPGSHHHMGICSARVAFHVMICFQVTRDESSVHDPIPKLLVLYDESGSHSGSDKNQLKM